MSKLIVEVNQIDEVYSHPNADRLDLVKVKGWQSVIPKGEFKKGDKCVFFPPDSILPEGLAERMGVKKYLSKNNRVKAARLRGEPSFGIVWKCEEEWPVGTDLVDFYGVRKYEPPVSHNAGDAEREWDLFTKYTDIENINNHPYVFEDGEPVVITEKIHGTLVRLSYNPEGERFVAGSNKVQRKEYDSSGKLSLYWKPFGWYEGIRELVKEHPVCIVYGEIFGSGIQDMRYGLDNDVDFRAFDIMINGKYLDYEDFKQLCDDYNIPTCNQLYLGGFSKQIVDEVTDGHTTICDPSLVNGFKGREGVVIKPEREQLSSSLGDRKILKSISVDYLSRKNAQDN